MKKLLSKLSNPLEMRKAAEACVLSCLFVIGFTSFFGLAIDLQDDRCLPWRVMLLYPLGSSPIERGDYVQFVAQPPNFFGKLNGGRAGKMIAGVPGDRIKVLSGQVSVNDNLLQDLEARAAEKLGRTIESFNAEYVLAEGEYFVVGTMPHSFDSRYWGPIKQSQIQKRLAGVL